MNWQIKLAVWLLARNKMQSVVLPMLSDGLKESTKMILEQTSKMDGSGEYKRAQALRALMNRHPEESERNCALSIEVSLCGVAY